LIPLFFDLIQDALLQISLVLDSFDRSAFTILNGRGRPWLLDPDSLEVQTIWTRLRPALNIILLWNQSPSIARHHFVQNEAINLLPSLLQVARSLSPGRSFLVVHCSDACSRLGAGQIRQAGRGGVDG